MQCHYDTNQLCPQTLITSGCLLTAYHLQTEVAIIFLVDMLSWKIIVCYEV